MNIRKKIRVGKQIVKILWEVVPFCHQFQPIDCNLHGTDQPALQNFKTVKKTCIEVSSDQESRDFLMTESKEADREDVYLDIYSICF